MLGLLYLFACLFRLVRWFKGFVSGGGVYFVLVSMCL